MSAPYVSELRLVSFNFAPKGWALCNGQTLPINSYTALFSLLGTTYGGNGINTFLLPNLQGQAPLHAGNNAGNSYVLGQSGGQATHTLTIPEMPTHPHTLQGINGAATPNAPPGNNLLSNTSGNLGIYAPPPNAPALMFPGDISLTGNGQPHANQSPYLVMNWILAIVGVFPSRN
jgi:microcystin-dependent protein